MVARRGRKHYWFGTVYAPKLKADWLKPLWPAQRKACIADMADAARRMGLEFAALRATP